MLPQMVQTPRLQFQVEHRSEGLRFSKIERCADTEKWFEQDTGTESRQSTHHLSPVCENLPSRNESSDRLTAGIFCGDENYRRDGLLGLSSCGN